MNNTNSLEHELKGFLIETLSLEDITPDQIESEMPLFGEGLGLDSIDALELGMAVHKKYKVSIDAKSPDTRKHFRSIASLAAFIAEQRARNTQPAPGAT